MNHECPHCYVDLKKHGLKTRLVRVEEKLGVYPCCPYCRTVLDINMSAAATGVSAASLIGFAILIGQSVRWFEALGYAYKDAMLFAALCFIVASFLIARTIKHFLPQNWLMWRTVARPAYVSRFQPVQPLDADEAL